MSSSARLVIAAGFVAASIIAAAQLTRMSRTIPDENRASAAGGEWVSDAGSTEDTVGTVVFAKEAEHNFFLPNHVVVSSVLFMDR